MAICKSCADGADGKIHEVAYCSVCDRRGIAVYNDHVPLDEQQVYVHKFPNTRIRCQGSRRPPVMKSVGHDRCNGCPCQHKPSGAWKGGG